VVTGVTKPVLLAKRIMWRPRGLGDYIQNEVLKQHTRTGEKGGHDGYVRASPREVAKGRRKTLVF